MGHFHLLLFYCNLEGSQSVTEPGNILLCPVTGFKCVPWTSKIRLARSVLKLQILGPDLWNQNLHFNTVPRGCACVFKCEHVALVLRPWRTYDLVISGRKLSI